MGWNEMGSIVNTFHKLDVFGLLLASTLECQSWNVLMCLHLSKLYFFKMQFDKCVCYEWTTNAKCTLCHFPIPL